MLALTRCDVSIDAGDCDFVLMYEVATKEAGYSMRESVEIATLSRRISCLAKSLTAADRQSECDREHRAFLRLDIDILVHALEKTTTSSPQPLTPSC